VPVLIGQSNLQAEGFHESSTSVTHSSALAWLGALEVHVPANNEGLSTSLRMSLPLRVISAMFTEGDILITKRRRSHRSCVENERLKVVAVNR
jgi:hypothetical protein